MSSTQGKSQTLTLAQQARTSLQLMPIDVPEDALQFETEGPTLDGTGRTSWRVDLETATATVEGERWHIPDLYASLYGLSEEDALADIRKVLHEADAMPTPTDDASTADASPDLASTDADEDAGAETPHEDTEAAVFELQGKLSKAQCEIQRLRNVAIGYGADPSEVQAADASADADEETLVDARGIEWGPPVPLHDAGDPDPIPLHTLPSWMRDHIESVAGAVQVPADLPALLTLCAAAGALQKKAVIEPRVGWREPLTLWGMGVLPSGARKSPTFKKITTPITDHEMLLREQVEQERTEALDMQEVLEDRLNAAKKSAVKADDLSEAEAAVQTARDELDAHEVPSMPALWSDDATSEALLKDMAANDGRMLVMSPEGDFLKFIAGRYDSGSVLNLYKKAWTGDEAVRDSRVGRKGSDVPNPALSVAICAQPTVLQDLAQKRTFRGEGLLARFLYVVPPSNVGNRLTGADVPPLDTAAKATFEKRLTDLWEVTPKTIEENGTWRPHVLRLEDRARAVFHDFEAEVETMLKPGAALDGLQDWGSKMVGQMLRLTGLIHISTHGPTKAMSTKVGPDTIAKATGVTRALSTHMRRAYALLEANERTQLAAYLWRRICDILGVTRVPNIPNTPKITPKSICGDYGDMGNVSKRDLWQATKRKTDINSVDDLDAPLHLLEEHRLVKVVTPETSGPGRPPSPRIHINPLAVEG